MKKITKIQFADAIVVYSSNPNSQRLGQFLMNTLVPKETDAEIFYEEGNIIAVDKFQRKYVEE